MERLVVIIQFGTIGLVLLGERLIQALGMDERRMPLLWHTIKQNKVAVCIGAWFICGTIAENLKKSGAFEIFFDGEKVIIIIH